MSDQENQLPGTVVLPQAPHPYAVVLPRAPHPSLEGFQEPVNAWFTASFEAPTRAQELAWPVIRSGASTLVLAPTGSGKTLAAFLAAIDRLVFEPVPPERERCRVLYVSPLKALAVDVERNLRAPLVGVGRYAERMGLTFHEPAVAIRTGDTPAKERAQFSRHPADILITTPESLYLLLTSNAREALRSVQCVIIDEIHAMAASKRGSHLALSLERLQEIAASPIQRIGLSATQRPLEEIARFLGGYGEERRTEGEEPGRGEEENRRTGDDGSRTAAEHQNRTAAEEPLSSSPLPPVTPSPCPPATPSPCHPVTPSPCHPVTPSPCPPVTPSPPHPLTPVPRPVQIVDAGSRKALDLRVEVPVEDMAKLGQPVEIPSGPAAQGEVRTSIWPAIYPLVLELIRSHRSTLIFVNSRRLAERLAAALNEQAGEEIVHAHHGSIAREQRLKIEDELKAGRLPAMVATSSLELGIDMGAIDLVIQVEAPPSVASGMQRIGRAGHQIDAPSKGVIIPKYRGDLVACAALTERMKEGAVEPTHYPRNPLDILAQQIVAMVAFEEWTLARLEQVVRRAAPFAELPHSMLEEVLDMLSGRYPSEEFAELRPRITWDRLNGVLRARQGARQVAISNAGAIPDRGLYGVYLVGAEKGQGRVGELDEEMVFESHVGETFLLGASTWRIEEITHDRVMVSPAPGLPGKMPFWHGETVGRPLEFGRAIGALTRQVRDLPPPAAITMLTRQHSLEEKAARNLVQYVQEQVEAIGAVPDDRTIVVESTVDEIGDWRVCILSPFGGRVHAPWAQAIGALVGERTDFDIDVLWTDDGIVVRFPEADEPPPLEAVIPDPDEVQDLVVRQLGGSALFAARFREAAARALLLPRRRPGQRLPLWQQRKKAADLLQVASKYRSFPMVLEAYRECLRDFFDMAGLVELLRQIRSRAIRLVPVTSRSPSPFAASVMFGYVANFIYEGDSPLAERRAQALAVDPAQLRELLGEVELRELLDADALEELELYLQHLTPERAARHPDGLHDLLLRLGDLGMEEIQARTAVPQEAPAWVDQLRSERRIISLAIGGEVRYVAAEDAGRYRDALGIPPPPGLPEAFLEYVRDPLGELVGRYARTHGPFHASDLAQRLGIGVGPVLMALQKFETSGRLLEGEFRPGGVGREWCDAGVLRALRQKSLARLRHEVEPVEQDVLARHYVAWQGIRSSEESGGERRRSRGSLLDVLEQLQGAAIPASVLESQVLPARLASYDPHELDALLASGQVLWVGREPIGQNDGRVSLYLVEHAALLLPPQVGADPFRINAAAGSTVAATGTNAATSTNTATSTDTTAGRADGAAGRADGATTSANGAAGRTDGAARMDAAVGRTDGPASVGPDSRAGNDSSNRRPNDPIHQESRTGNDSSNRRPNDPIHRKIREFLAARGASFFPLILAATGGFPPETLQALWDLVWAGEVTNDTLGPLRSYLSARGGSRSRDRKNGPPVPSPAPSSAPARGLHRRFPTSGYTASSIRSSAPTPARALPPEAAGRWSLVSGLVYGEPTPTERLAARTRQFLDRYGVLTREAVQAEGIEGGFSAVYGILKAMEESGQVRRGYFVSGLGATQFAVPGAVDRLRALREPGEEPQTFLLAATDPANPYGAAIPWPERGEGGRPMRMAGAQVILVDGALAAWIARGERQVLTYLNHVGERDPEDVAWEIARILASQAAGGRRRAIFITEVDGKPTRESPLAPALLEAGFTQGVNGFLKRGSQ